MSKEEFIAKMKKCTTYTNYHALVQELKGANGGYYPEWWYSTVYSSGLYNEVSRRFTDLGKKQQNISIPGIPDEEFADFNLDQ